MHMLDVLLGDDLQDTVRKLLNDVRILNFINLNLEVKHSFKGWAGLMHQLVFSACADATEIPTDVYAMRQRLIEKGVKS